MTELKAGGLFYGYGGIEMGLRSVVPSVNLCWYAEFDKKASLVGAHHHPGVPNYGDVTKIDWREVEPVDILTGGSPCQDLSHAGKRLGMADGTRSGLWASMCDAIDIIRPRLVVWENVRGALSARSHKSETVVRVGPRGGRKVEVTHRALGRVLADLAELGYDARWYGLRAADVGAPHGRFRIFLFAVPSDSHVTGLEGWRAGGERTGERATGPGSVETGAADRELTLLPTPRTSDTNGAGSHGQGGPDLRTVVDRLLPTPTTTQRGTDANLDTRDGARANLHNEVAKLLPTPTVSDAKASGAHGYNGNEFCTLTDATVRGVVDWREYEPAIRRWEGLFRPAPQPTELSGKGQPRLSPRFTEWMMGLPVGYVTDVPGIGRNDALKAHGNGVVPQQAAAAFRAFLSDSGWRP